VDTATYTKFDVEVPFRLNVYVLVHYLLLLGFTSYFLFGLAQFDWVDRLAAVILIALSLAALGELLAAKKWATAFEYFRLAVATGLLIYLFPFFWMLAIAFLFVLICIVTLYYIQKP